MFLAENIKYLREQDGLTQREFAEKLGVSSGAVGMWESGTREPELSRIIKMAELFAMSLDDLILTKLRPQIPLYLINIKYLRAKNGIKQEEMAGLLRLSNKSQYCKRENTDLEFKASELEKICDFFGVTLDQLFKQDLSKGVE